MAGEDSGAGVRALLAGALAMTEAFPNFAAAVAAHLEQGAKIYGDRSFAEPPDVLIGEVEQKLLDVCPSSFTP